MHPIILLLVFSLLHAYEARGSDTGTPVFVQKGKDLLLNVTAPVKLVKDSEFKWLFKDSGIFRLLHDNRTKINRRYDGRVEIFLPNHSLLLKNVQQVDSGRYTAAVIGEDINYMDKYSVTVQDPVSLVNGTVDLLSSSSDSCNLTVTCSTQDSHHINSTFRCDNNTCSQEGGERSKVTTSGSSLRVYLSEAFSVICSHSNQVSLDEHKTMIRNFCFSNPASEALRDIITASVTVSVILVLVIIAIAAAFVRHRKKGKHETEEMKNTVYESVQVQSLNPLPDQHPTDDAAAPSPSSIYSLIEVGSIKSTEAGDTTQPESLYAQVEKSALA